MKKEIRNRVLQKLKQIPAEEKTFQESELSQKLFHSAVWKRAETVSLTLSLSHELNTAEIINQGLVEGKKLVIPRCQPANRTMTFYPFTDRSSLIRSSFGVLEPDPDVLTPVDPEEIDLIIVPGIAFTSSGQRIGHGGGYYDRFLAKHPDIETVSLVLQEQLVKEIPTEVHDINIKQIYQFKKESSS
ncbi:5-formyltetrahydrofolate cyclo-ligase [Salisediminibacterium beveridgei]|nr:5-formyltetrahydrofolate cyclo-ligase [Salisediminibacterium beveridgei]